MDFDDAYDRAATDPWFLRGFAAHYRGAYDPLDALLWAGHPDRPGPSGAAAPWRDRRLLEAAAYSESSDEAQRAAALEALDLLDQQLASEKTRVRAALDQTASDPEATDDLDGEADEQSRPPSASRSLALDVAPVGRAGWSGGRRRLVLGGAAVLVVGIALGWLGSTLSTVLPSAGSAPRSTLSPGIDELFAAQQKGSDIPQSVIFAQIGGISDIDVGTARALDLGISGDDLLNHAFVAKSNEGEICVFLTHDDGRIARSCAAPERFAASGVSISWTTTENFRAGRPPEPSAVGISIDPDGSIDPTVTRYFYLGGSVTDEDEAPTESPTESPAPSPSTP